MIVPLVDLLDVHRHAFEGFAGLALDLAQHHLGPGHAELVALAAHVLDQDPEVQFAAPGDLELVGVRGLLDPQRDVVLELFQQALAQHAEVTYLPSRPANGEVLTWKVMLTVGSSTFSGGRASTLAGSQSVSEMYSSSMPVKVMMSPACRLGNLDPVQAVENP
jgi:hypothetical protein